MSLSNALLDLQELTLRLRRDCPWDREQTARTIVPHTIEEAYEVADAALADRPDKLLDELGDLLFATVNVARRLNVDPELALRTRARRFADRVERAEELAKVDGREFTELPLDEQDRYFDAAKEELR